MLYESLLREAEKERIEVVYRPLRGKIKGLYSDHVIAVSNKTVTAAERSCILAEELGHYHTSTGNILDQAKVQNRKQERRARVWSYHRLVPLDKLILAYKDGIKNRFQLAEYLHVTEHFLDAAIRHYREKHGIYCRVGEYWICFEPLGILESFE